MVVASQLKERVAIEAPVASSDGQGGQNITWHEGGTVWAEVRTVGNYGRERASGQQAEAAAGYRVRIRTHIAVNATMRLRWRARILAVHSVHEQEAMLELLAYEEGL